jgi:hypothetical protein
VTTLDDCRLKAIRAEKHLHEIRAELDAWFKRETYKVVFNENPEDPEEMVIAIGVEEEPPAYLGAILGDFLNNCRSILDYITTRLDLVAGGPGDKIYFPIFENRAAFNDHAAEKLSHLNPSHVALIESLQPFNGTRRPIAKHPGAVLHRLHRLDKHHAVTPAIAAPVSFQVRFVFDDQVEIKSVKTEIGGEVHDGTEIARVRWPVRPRARKVEMRPRIGFALVFGDVEWAHATTPILAWVRDDVLSRFAPILRKLG